MKLPRSEYEDLILRLADETRRADRAERELERERESLPTPGVWLVNETTTGWSGRWVAIGGYPEPMRLASTERHRDTMAAAIREIMDVPWVPGEDGNRYLDLPSAWAIADAVIQAIAESEAKR